MPSDWCRTKQYKTNRIFVTYKIHLHTKSTVPPTKLSAKASAPPSESYAYIQAQVYALYNRAYEVLHSERAKKKILPEGI